MPFDESYGAIWAAIRADIAPLAEAASGLSTVRAVRGFHPLWPGRVPKWALPR
jgi:hypothetical protein